MPQSAVLDLTTDVYRDIHRHVLPPHSRHEEAVFVFARSDGAGNFTLVDLYRVPPEGFDHRSPYFLELTDETRQLVIKRGHDLCASVIEIHSHPLQKHAAFSTSDRRGFREFVPHLLWRLGGRPYGAIVVAEDSFDSLAWFDTVEATVPMAIRLDGNAVMEPTGETHSTWGPEGDFDE